MFNTNTWRGQIVDLATTKTLSEILRHFFLKLVFTNTSLAAIYKIQYGCFTRLNKLRNSFFKKNNLMLKLILSFNKFFSFSSADKPEIHQMHVFNIKAWKKPSRCLEVELFQQRHVFRLSFIACCGENRSKFYSMYLMFLMLLFSQFLLFELRSLSRRMFRLIGIR